MAISLAATALGLARFGYGVLLPAMRADLGWSYAQAGAMNTANAAGYLAGAVTATAVLAAVGERRSFAASFVITAGSLLASGLTDTYPALLSLRALAGGAGAVLFISGSALAARLATASRSPGLVLGTYYAGVGPGIGVSALLAPTILGTADRWRMGWLVMGLVAAGSAAVAIPAARTIPAGPAPIEREPTRLDGLGWPMAAFTLFGLGYIPYLTFAIAHYDESGRTSGEITAFWVLLAVAATSSAWLWRPLLDRARGGDALAALLAAATIGSGLSLVSGSLIAMLASAAVFGATFLSVIAAMAQLIRQVLPPHQWARGLAAATSLFAIGQMIAPALIGWLADRSGDLRGGLATATAVLAAGAVVATVQRWGGGPRTSQPAP